MSCKCDGIVRYDSVKKKLLYRSGCDWLDVPASALSGEGVRPDIDFGDEELPTPPDGNQSQNYACREAYEIMRHLQGIANYGYLQSVKDYTEFVRLTGTPTGIAFKGQVSRYFYDQARKPENAQAFQELTGDDTQRDIFVCQLAEALTKGPGWTTDDDVALYDLIQGMSSIPKLIYTYALHLTDTNELNDIATAAAYDESVPCPCGAANSANVPAKPALATWSVESDFKTGQHGVSVWVEGATDWGSYVAGTGFVNGSHDYEDVADATQFLRVMIDWQSLTGRILRIDYQLANVVEGRFNSAEGTPNNDVEKFLTYIDFDGYNRLFAENGNGWHSQNFGNTTARVGLWFLFGYQETNIAGGGLPSDGQGTLIKVRLHGTGTKPAWFTTNGWTDVT